MMNDYQRIAKAINFLSQHVEQQPSLGEVAAHVHLSAFHFQRLFCRWVGISPKRFLQVMTLEKARPLVAGQLSMLQTSERVGLSSSSRLYDHFVTLDAVTPGEFKNGGRELSIEYGFHPTLFGEMLIARTRRGICNALFIDGETRDAARQHLQQLWPHAHLVENAGHTVDVARQIGTLSRGGSPADPIALHVRGSSFQMAVWRALLSTGSGDSVSYSTVAQQMRRPLAVRAVANAVAANPVALLIPCHRVIRSSGALGGYRWGLERKQNIRLLEHIHSVL